MTRPTKRPRAPRIPAIALADARAKYLRALHQAEAARVALHQSAISFSMIDVDSALEFVAFNARDGLARLIGSAQEHRVDERTAAV